jgi:hypothetical protein
MRPMASDFAVASLEKNSPHEPAHFVGRAVRSPAILPAARADIAALADSIRIEEPRIGDTGVFAPHARIGWGGGMAILIGDAAEIPLMIGMGGHHLDYRMGWLARDGDLVVVGGAYDTAFEAYQKAVLGQPGIDYLHVPSDQGRNRRPVPIVCLRESEVFDVLLSRVRQHGGATLIAHITTGSIWALAARLGEASGRTVHVAGPPPLLSRRVNDKMWFGSVAGRLLGSGKVPEKRRAHSFSALVRHVMDLAGKRERLVVKVPDSAGSAGNVVLRCDALRRMSTGAVFDRLRRSLHGLGSPTPFPVALEVWDCNVMSSPSVQTWIPREPKPPVVEGLYEQVLAEDDRQFVGAVEAELPETLDREMSEGGMQLALLFQQLGYYGRCSFDTVAYGPSPEAARLHWIECNGRWGGVSVPMTLAERLTGDMPRPAHVIVQRGGLYVRPRPFQAVRAVFDQPAPKSNPAFGSVCLSPNRLADGTGYHFLSFGPNRRVAVENSKRVISQLSA